MSLVHLVHFICVFGLPPRSLYGPPPGMPWVPRAVLLLRAPGCPTECQRRRERRPVPLYGVVAEAKDQGRGAGRVLMKNNRLNHLPVRKRVIKESSGVAIPKAKVLPEELVFSPEEVEENERPAHWRKHMWPNSLEGPSGC